jgi:hypothetical protein
MLLNTRMKKIGRPKVPLAERMHRYTQRGEGCWLWTGPVGKHGYGVLTTHLYTKEKVYLKAHRLSFLLHSGLDGLPEDQCVCHRCDNPLCVNPSHLFLDTNAGNQHDKVRKGRQIKGEQHYAAKLTEHDVLEIRRIHKEGATTLVALGARFGIDPATVGNIVKRRKWKHLP